MSGNEKELAKKLVDNVVSELKSMGFTFFQQEPFGSDGTEWKTKPTRLGNSIVLAQKNNIFFSSILSNSSKIGFLCRIDTLLRKEIAKKFELNKVDLFSVNEEDTFNVKEIALKISKSFRCYEKAWKNIMTDKEIQSIVDGVLKRHH